jgi:hypothetical protein
MLKFLQARIKFVEKLFEDNKFEFVFSYMAQMAPSMIVYEFCNRESIPFFRPHHSRIKDLRIVYDNIYEYSDIVWERANEILANKSVPSQSGLEFSVVMSPVQSVMILELRAPSAR